MARRTKEEALATRHKLLDAAQYLFQKQGVSHTSLQDIARQAGATRGAVYWHFKDKVDLFNAMMDRVTLPLEASFKFTQTDTDADTGAAMKGEPQALRQIRNATLAALSRITNDARTRCVLEVATQKVEYVAEFQAVRLRYRTMRHNFLSFVAHGLELAARQTGLKLGIPASVAAQGLHALIDGLIQDWFLEPDSFQLLEVGQSLIDVYLQGLGFSFDQRALTSRPPDT